ncbi:glyoxalase/bleomycin resistance protein/dioxygenase superfamily protein [Caballeronia arvi]|uniref:Glyoxalase/bleomycin resistance protein/dioxygenase superfamily protein n=1 Tax=Caballeronia arvi TaxID=1777135 RepID=A0A158GNC5_9BURK|nr:VOC family protein [Caballeronia arvi]SAL33321.1 glyoxalase/bleomycin resistance protein/dioxygenase superfamily protein [Caballeronia arvi]
MTDWKPANYPSVSPYLICENAETIIAFLERVFDGALVRRFDRPDGSLMHAEVRIDDSIVMIGGGAADHQSSGPHIHVYVRDAQAVYDRAIQNGAQSVQAPTRKRDDDDFRGGFRDAAGTTWWVGTQ